jgi:hypothetical protein
MIAAGVFLILNCLKNSIGYSQIFTLMELEEQRGQLVMRLVKNSTTKLCWALTLNYTTGYYHRRCFQGSTRKLVWKHDIK